MPAMKAQFAMRDVDGLVRLVRSFRDGKLEIPEDPGAQGENDDPKTLPRLFPQARSSSASCQSFLGIIRRELGQPRRGQRTQRSDHFPEALRRLSWSKWRRIATASQHLRYTRFHSARLAREA